MGLKLLINSLFRGGAEKQFAALAALLPHETLLLLEDEVRLPVPVRPLFLSDNRASTSSLVKTASIPLYARHLAALTAPGDTVLSFMERANIVNVLAAARSGHTAVICERTSPSGEFSGLRGALMRPLIRRYYPRADLVVANSEGVKRDLLENFGVPAQKLRVVPNGCDCAAIARQAAAPLPEGWDALFRRPVVVTGGRLTAAKGHWHLLRAFREVRRTVPGAALLFLGEGGLERYLLGLARGLGLAVFSGAGAPPPDADVYFAGYRPNPYLFISRARLFAFTSLWEGFPNALLEAMACGTPVVSSDCASGPREILAPSSPRPAGAAGPEHAEFGVLMPPLSGRRLPPSVPPEPAEAAWAAKLAELLNAPAALSAYSAAGAKRAADFELSKAAALWQELLKTAPHHIK